MAICLHTAGPILKDANRAKMIVWAEVRQPEESLHWRGTPPRPNTSLAQHHSQQHSFSEPYDTPPYPPHIKSQTKKNTATTTSHTATSFGPTKLNNYIKQSLLVKREKKNSANSGVKHKNRPHPVKGQRNTTNQCLFGPTKHSQALRNDTYEREKNRIVY